MTDFDNTCVPKSQRQAAFTIAALHQWEMDVNDDRCEASAEEVGIPSFFFYSVSTDLFVDLHLYKWISETLDRVSLGGPFPSVSCCCCRPCWTNHRCTTSFWAATNLRSAPKPVSDKTGTGFAKSRNGTTPPTFSETLSGP